MLRVTIMIAPIAAELRAADPRLETAGQVVEAVGIEPSSEHPVSHDSVAIMRNGLDAETPLNLSESKLADQLGTRVPNLRRPDEWLAHIRSAWGALRVV